MKIFRFFIILIILLYFIYVSLFSLKDPFHMPDFIEKQIDSKLKLDGIVKIKDKYGAIICKGLNKSIVFEGEEFLGLKVKEISLNYVTVLKGSKLIKLSLK